MDDPWGRDTPPALTGEPPPLPPRLAELAALTGPRDLAPDEAFRLPSFSELPEVQELLGHGWHVLGGELMFMALPAVWPAEHRCWLPDRLPRASISSCTGGIRRVEPRSLEDRDEHDAEWAEIAASAGVPAPPRGRIWLLRSPWPSLAYEVVLSILEDRAVEHYGRLTSTEVTAAAREVLSGTEEQVWVSWHGPLADAARQWRCLGREGEQAAGVVLRGLTSDHLATLAAGDGAGLTEEQAIAWSRAVRATGEEAVRRIRGWLEIGLPVDPPCQMWRLEDLSPVEVGRWLEAGFGLDDVVLLRGLPVERALGWRHAGFTTEQAHRLLSADPTLTPEEARAFAAAEIVDTAAVPWLECGFSADEAKAWTQLDVLPQEARVWRSVGKGPAEAREHRRAGGGPMPPDVQVGWTGYGTGREHRQYGVSDPPGTRGRIARDQGRRGRHY